MNHPDDVIMQLEKNYRVRPAAIDDAQQVADLMNACSQLLTGKDEWDAGELIADWGDPQFDLENNSLMVFAGEKLIAYSEFWGIMPPFVRNSYLVRVHPDYRDQKIGTQVNQWAEARAKAISQKAAPDLKVILTCIINHKDECARKLMTDFGSEIVRTTWVMEADLTQEIDDEQLPDGYSMRIARKDEIPEIFALKLDTFLDHWGSMETPFEEGLQQFKSHYVNDPFYRPDLWFVVEYLGEKVGLVIGNAATSFGSDYGWINILGVKRAHRKHGVGRVLLQHCNRAIKKAGGNKVGLSVDASSLTGATKLYEDAGFKLIEEHLRYEKVLRDGNDIRTQTLAE